MNMYLVKRGDRRNLPSDFSTIPSGMEVLSFCDPMFLCSGEKMLTCISHIITLYFLDIAFLGMVPLGRG